MIVTNDAGFGDLDMPGSMWLTSAVDGRGNLFDVVDIRDHGKDRQTWITNPTWTITNKEHI